MIKVMVAGLLAAALGYPLGSGALAGDLDDLLRQVRKSQREFAKNSDLPHVKSVPMAPSLGVTKEESEQTIRNFNRELELKRRRAR